MAKPHMKFGNKKYALYHTENNRQTANREVRKLRKDGISARSVYHKYGNHTHIYVNKGQLNKWRKSKATGRPKRRN